MRAFPTSLKKFKNFQAGGSKLLPDQLLFSIEKAIEMAEDHMMSLQTLVPSIKNRDPSVGLYASQDDAAMDSVKKVENFIFSIGSLKEIAGSRPLSG